MTLPLAAKDASFSDVFGVIVALVVGLVLVIGTYVVVREAISPRYMRNRLRRFFGRAAYAKLETHDKSFPAYDLASVHRALASFLDEACSARTALGACPYGTDSMRALMDRTDSYQPTKSPHERVPVDVDHEESFPTNCVYTAVLRPGTGMPMPHEGAGPAPAAPSGGVGPLPYETPTAGGERVAVLLSASTAKGNSYDYDGDLENRAAPPTNLAVSVACRDRAVADRFFADLEARRRRLSVFRGKVIDPHVDHGRIKTIGFRRLERVREDDLVLPEQVKRLIRSAAVGFYRHHRALRGLGVELKRGLLLHGVPGTGKTSIGLYLAGLLPNFTVCFVSGERLTYPRELCRMARYLQPTMIVFEDVDLIAQERDTNGLATVLGELMNQIDGCDPDDQVLFLMNTNSLDRLEQAVRNRPGRVDQIIQIPLPDAAARATLVRRFARNLALGPAADLGRVVAATEGVTPAGIKEIVKRAAVMAVERVEDERERRAQRDPAAAAIAGAGDEDAGDAEPLVVTEADLLLAAEQVQLMRGDATGLSSRAADAVL